MRTSDQSKEDYRKTGRRAASQGSAASSVVGAICILVYIGAIAFGIVRFFISSDERRGIAEAEFDSLADLAMASVPVLGFGTRRYKDAIQDFVVNSRTIEGVIISGSDSGYDTFERPGEHVFNREGESPRFRQAFGNAREPLHRPLMIDGQRNVTIQAVYSLIDQEQLTGNLKITLIAILGGLALAFLTLILETAFSGRKASYKSPETSAANDDFEDVFETGPGGSQPPGFEPAPAEPPPVIRIPPRLESPPARQADPPPAGEAPPEKPLSEKEGREETPPEPEKPAAPSRQDPKGLFSPRGSIGWESYTRERLASELHRCASFEQDLTFIAMEFTGLSPMGDELYRSFADEAVNFFTQRDLVFEKGGAGISIIVPNAGLEQGLAASEEFYVRLREQMPEAFEGGADLSIGVSSRSGRLVDAERLMLEARQALKRALEDPAARVIAFKSDPEKYREFLKRRQSRG